MDKELKDLIEKYNRYLRKGEENIVEGQSSFESQAIINIQKIINRIWIIVINDLNKIADKYKHEDQKK